MGEVPLSLHVNSDLKQRLDDEARRQQVSPDDLVERAIESYLEIEGSERELLRERIAEANRGSFISGEAMHRWIASWETDEELPLPEPDVFLPPRKR